MSLQPRHLYVAQRVSAMLLAPLVIVHLLLILYAVRNGLSADEILARTRGNYLWGLFYTVFVAAAAVHAPIGLRNVLKEWSALSSRLIDGLCWVMFALFLFAGLRAVLGVI